MRSGPAARLLVLLAALLCTACTSQTQQAVPQDGVQSLALWVDPIGTADFEHARQQPYDPLPAALMRSGSTVANWVRIDLRRRVASEGPWVLRLRSRPGTQLSLHIARPTDCTSLQGLDAAALQGRPRALTGWLSFPLCPGIEQVHVRFVASAEAFLQAEALPAEAAQTRDLLDTATVYVVLGGMALALLLAVGQLVAQRNRLGAAVLLQLLSFNAYLFAQLAPSAQSSLAALTRLLSQVEVPGWRGAMVLGLLLFLRTWLDADQPRRRALHALDVTILLALLAIPLSLAGHSKWADTLSALAFLPSLPMAAALALTSRQPWLARRLPSLLVVLLGWASALALYQRVDPQPLALTALLFQGLISGLLLSRMAQRAREAVRTATESRMEAEARNQTRELLLMLAHELRTPLMVVRLSVDSPYPSESSRVRASAAIRDMDHLIERCLQTTHLDHAQGPPQLTTVHLDAVLPDLLQRWDGEARLQKQFAAALPAVRSNETIIGMIVGVLVDNALRYGAKDQPVVVTASDAPTADGAGVELIVANAAGPAGVPDATRTFSKYYRSADARHSTGAGLGLHLASRLAQQMGASLSLDSADRQRIAFRLWLPC